MKINKKILYIFLVFSVIKHDFILSYSIMKNIFSALSQSIVSADIIKNILEEQNISSKIAVRNIDNIAAILNILTLNPDGLKLVVKAAGEEYTKVKALDKQETIFLYLKDFGAQNKDKLNKFFVIKTIGLLIFNKAVSLGLDKFCKSKIVNKSKIKEKKVLSEFTKNFIKNCFKEFYLLDAMKNDKKNQENNRKIIETSSALIELFSDIVNVNVIENNFYNIIKTKLFSTKVLARNVA